MLSRLDTKYDAEFEVISHPRDHYKTTAWQQENLPAAPAIMIGEEIVTAGKDIKEELLEAAICRHLGLPAPSTDTGSFLGRLFGKK